MGSTYYSAAWTDSGSFLACSHGHETVLDADCCIPCAGGYVVCVENGVMRSLTAEEEAEFQGAHYAPRTDKPPLDAIPAAPAEAAISDCIPPGGEGETYVEFVFRFLSAYGVAPHAESIPIVKHSAINIDMIDLVLSRLGDSEANEFARMYTEDKHALLIRSEIDSVPSIRPKLAELEVNPPAGELLVALGKRRRVAENSPEEMRRERGELLGFP